jgi:hypothetical protein
MAWCEFVSKSNDDLDLTTLGFGAAAGDRKGDKIHFLPVRL